MWAQFRLLIGTPSAFLISLLVFHFPAQAIGQTLMTAEDLEDPEFIVQKLREGVSKQNQAAGERYYQDALKRMKQNYWDAAAKNFGESAIFYPTAKAFIGMVEAEARIAERHNQATKLRFLESLSKYLASAAAVDAFQKQLTPAETEQLKQDMDCINKFLATRTDANCRLVKIAFGQGN